jgi:exodeoxyribonuclease VII large subunit
MMDLIDDPAPGQNAPEFTVSEISGAVKRVLEGEFGRIRVRGEVGRVMIARTGHMYFDLKDDRSVIGSVSWKGQVAKMVVKPEEGMEVVATGRMTSFAPQSKYQLQVESVVPAGAGALMAMLEKRKQALAAEGLFAAERKRPIPYLPRVIGVVTSPSGAVIRDILHRLRDRFPTHVVVWPVVVQGERCARDVAAAIAGFNAIVPGGPVPRPDLIIVARGGGSIEDLWGFNEEIVVRAAAASAIPLISAVGHETDTTLIDHASDMRAPTPTAAAELAVPVRSDLLAHLAGQVARLIRAGAQSVTTRRQRLHDLARALPRLDGLLASSQQRFDIWAERLPGSLRVLVGQKRLALGQISAGLRPGAVVQRAARDRETLGSRTLALDVAVRRLLQRRFELAIQTGRGLRAGGLMMQVAKTRDDLAKQSGALDRAVSSHLADQKRGLDGLERLRQTLGYTETLRRGYAVVRDEKGTVVTRSHTALAAAALEIQFSDGRVTVGGASEEETPETALATPVKPKRKPKSSAGKPPDQGSLF